VPLRQSGAIIAVETIHREIDNFLKSYATGLECGSGNRDLLMGTLQQVGLFYNLDADHYIFPALRPVGKQRMYWHTECSPLGCKVTGLICHSPQFFFRLQVYTQQYHPNCLVFSNVFKLDMVMDNDYHYVVLFHDDQSGCIYVIIQGSRAQHCLHNLMNMFKDCFLKYNETASL